jgi:membrane peptidoglycan carboxypeptidase
MDLSKDKGKRVLSAQNTRVENMVLRQVIERGTGVRARLPHRVAAGKTGTSQGHQNAWFVGFTPQLTTAVWMGAPIGNISMTNVGGVKVAGGTYPARIWGAFMTEALAGEPSIAFPAPNPRLIPAGKYIKDDKISTDPMPTSSTKLPPVTVTTLLENTIPPTSTFDRPVVTRRPRPPRTTTTRPECFPFCDGNDPRSDSG